MSGTSPWWEQVELSPHKIASLRFPSLTVEERRALLALFLAQPGEDGTPANPVVPGFRQEQLQQIRPISLEPVRELTDYLGLDLAVHLRVPAVAEDQQALRGAECVVADQVLKYERKGDEVREEVHNRLRRVYAYLRGEAGPQPLVQFGPDIPVDLAVVPGCRGMGMRLRVARGVSVMETTAPRPRMILSGWQPYYARQFDHSHVPESRLSLLPFGEAEAMATVAEELLPGLFSEIVMDTDAGAPRVIIDPRARNTVETIVHAIPVIHEIRAALGRPVSVCLVTSPYHVRRLHLITMHHLGHFFDIPQSVGTVSVAAAASGVDLAQLLDPGDQRHRYAVELYVRESFKLLGGRMTGEF